MVDADSATAVPEYRQPTIAQAAHLVMISLTKEYRRLSIAYWREHYGDEFADAVQAEVEERWKGRKR